MKCPNCLYTMECISEIHNVPGQPGRRRMNLHCVRPNDFNGKYPGGRGCLIGGCHMGVITEDPKCWECHEYNLDFHHDNQRYRLSSCNHAVDPYHQMWREPETTLSSQGREIVRMPHFIPLSTDNDMHERAWELFHRLRNLAAFA
jgi:hypothetical protein